MLPLAMAQGSALGGAGVMLAFGVATLPAMLGAGYVLAAARRYLRGNAVRQCLGVLVLAFGVWSVSTALQAHH